jgi:hypothetical protein
MSTANMTPKAAALGSAVGSSKGKKSATMKTPTVQERAKQLKQDRINADIGFLTRALALAVKGNQDCHSVGSLYDAAVRLPKGELLKIIDTIPEAVAVKRTGTADVLALSLAECIINGCPTAQKKTTKAKAAKTEKINPDDAFTELFAMMEAKAGCPADMSRIALLVASLPAGHKDDDDSESTIRNLMAAFKLPVTGTKAIVTQRIAEFTGAATKSHGASRIEPTTIDNMDAEELDRVIAWATAAKAKKTTATGTKVTA